MAPLFETAKSFVDVPITEDGVETASFLVATTDFLNMFDLLGHGVFGFVQSDLRGNLAGVRTRYEATPSQSTTLEKLVICATEDKERHSVPCLVRLIRGLLFTCQALQNMQSDKSTELHVCFKRSYDVVLKHHHTFIIRSAVAVRGSHEKFDSELAKWLDALDIIVKRVKTFLEEGGYGRV
ncbi:glycolipid transfer protein domain-containing protein [Fomitopsis serialis]|uniref:glycolipid transfer protein domain-containing protein n=1 Tax=Fomitopsis serialis TaxID=139415 RepID=UPI002007AE56|nr:glycolipid transfer protein domain-containing protein [Neoantrodia serialis]KAH9926909.1 glycolipid transfer protein domain-containing protein [Neoantrodia serialis]